jgi:hypothetical protein
LEGGYLGVCDFKLESLPPHLRVLREVWYSREHSLDWSRRHLNTEAGVKKAIKVSGCQGSVLSSSCLDFAKTF